RFGCRPGVLPANWPGRSAVGPNLWRPARNQGHNHGPTRGAPAACPLMVIEMLSACDCYCGKAWLNSHYEICNFPILPCLVFVVISVFWLPPTKGVTLMRSLR